MATANRMISSPADNKTKSHSEVKNYISNLLEGGTDRKIEARNALIRSGVLKKNGAKKNVIVSWE